MWLQLIRRVLLVVLIRPFASLVLGFEVRGRRHLPWRGPAIVAANHNSHIDTVLLLSLFPSGSLHNVRPLAAADHFLSSPFARWFSQQIVGILPVARGKASRSHDVLAGSREALERGEILLVFPEGTRGEPEEMGPLKSGIARLAESFPDAPVVPVFLQGAGRALPRNARVLVPFNCFAIVGEPFTWGGDRAAFMARLRNTFEALSTDAPPLRWL